MTDLTAICDACRAPVADGDGYLHIDLAAVRRSEGEPEWDAARLDGMSVADLLATTPRVRWQLHHDACDPQSSDAGRYSIETERIRTWAALTWWTAHLMEKSWLAATDWDVLLRSAADATGTRITPAMEVRNAA